jgi:hypothetical protein
VAKTWKSVESKICRMLGLERAPVTGRIRGSAADCQHKDTTKTPFFSVEVKHRESLPDWMLDAMAQAKASMRNDTQLPVVVFHQKGMEYGDSVVMLRLKDFSDYFGGQREEN